jgi:hypothetical protein
MVKINWKAINGNKNIILALFFGTWAGFKEHSFEWGLFIVALGFLIFTFMDKMRAPLGQGPLDKYIGVTGKRRDHD